jgi:hypothetical protein
LELQKHTRSLLVTDAWLLASGDDARWCKLPDCPHIIACESSEPPIDPGLKKNARGKYKTRADKVFCCHAHAAKYSYRKRAGWFGYV